MLLVLLPSLIVIFTAVIAPPPRTDRPWVSSLLAFGFLCILVRYLCWRFFDTVMPANEVSLNALVVWLVFLVELLAWAEMIILVCVILRRTDRSAEADEFEWRFREMPEEGFPTVDVFIATYNEPLEVLEKTIAGALALCWPKDKLNIFVLDDGRREWLMDYCFERGVAHLTRDDNRNAKAGNINAALARSSGEFILVLDADFVPNNRMLVRAVGFFEDPKVGIVQMPHHFFNGDPIQTSLNVQGDLPDEQRFFFDVIQPGRDGWNCAFCCGSNGIIRRAALQTIGGQMPTQSITEDMLLTLALLRKGFVTRYLNERLAIGLAPENLQAYFIQRARWAQGAIQIMFLRLGPFGPGLSPMKRLLFVPSHWISQSICQPVAATVPGFFLLTGIAPILNATVEDVVLYQVPAVIAAFALMQNLASEKFAALSATAQSLLQAFRTLPTVVSTLANPKGHIFMVTPKGVDARTGGHDSFTIRLSALIIALTGLGLLLNAQYSTRIVADAQLLPVVAFWAIVNMVVLLIVITMAVPRPVLRVEERFAIRETCAIQTRKENFVGEIIDVSAAGAQVRIEAQDILGSKMGTWLGVELAGVGIIPAQIKRIITGTRGEAEAIGVEFVLPSGAQRDALIQKVFTQGAEPSALLRNSRIPVSLQMLIQVFKMDGASPKKATTPLEDQNETSVPAWLHDVSGLTSNLPSSSDAWKESEASRVRSHQAPQRSA